MPKGTRILDAAARIGVDVLHYCYHPGLSAPGAVPHVPGGGGEGAQADAGVRHHRGGRQRHPHPEREGAEEPPGHARVLPGQPPAGLPRLRPVGRVQAAGLRRGRGPGDGPAARAQAGLRPRRLRRRRALRGRPLHHVHALRALHARGGAGRAAERSCSAGTATSSTPSSTRGSRATSGPTTSSTSAPWARWSPRTSCTRPAPGTWTAPPPSAPTARRAATSPCRCGTTR